MPKNFMMSHIEKESIYSLSTSPDVANIAKAHCMRGEYDIGFRLFKDAFEESNKYFGLNHPRTLQIKQRMNDILNMQEDKAKMHMDKDEHDKALELSKCVFEMRFNYFKSDHIKLLQAKHDLDSVLSKFLTIVRMKINENKYDEAFKMSKDVFEMIKKYFESDPPSLLQTKHDLDFIISKLLSITKMHLLERKYKVFQMSKDVFEMIYKYSKSEPAKIFQFKHDMDYITSKLLYLIKIYPFGSKYESFQISKDVFEMIYKYSESHPAKILQFKQDLDFILSNLLSMTRMHLFDGKDDEAFQMSKDVFEITNKYSKSDPAKIFQFKPDMNYIISKLFYLIKIKIHLSENKYEAFNMSKVVFEMIYKCSELNPAITFQFKHDLDYTIIKLLYLIKMHLSASKYEAFKMSKDVFEMIHKYSELDPAKTFQFKPDLDYIIIKLLDITRMHLLQSKYEAFKMFKDVVEMIYKFSESDPVRELQFKTDLDSILSNLLSMTRMHLVDGKYDEAFQMSKDVFEITNKYFESDHHITLQAKQYMNYSVNVHEDTTKFFYF